QAPALSSAPRPARRIAPTQSGEGAPTMAGPGTTTPATSTQVQVDPATRVSVDRLRAYGIEAFTKAGLAEEGAREVTEVQLESNLRNQPTHNMGNVPGYAKRMQGGMIKTACDIKPLRESPV